MMEEIKGLLINLDGVVFNDTVLMEGAAESIRWLQEKKIPYRFISNTTMKSRETLCQKLMAFGISSKKEDIFSAVYAAVVYIQKSGKKKCHLLLMEDAIQEFSGFDMQEQKPDFVVIGDLGKNLNFELMNTALRMLLSGAELIALQKNPYSISDQGYTLDTGAVVAMLEFSSGKKSQIMGKPSPHFFALVLDDLKLAPENVVIIGNDIESDIKGAQRMGIRGVLVNTGKYQPDELQREKIKPWRVMESIRDLKSIFNPEDQAW
jgi:phospholysine phosphohistidine inorganic pyrophosphate phosphatase